MTRDDILRMAREALEHVVRQAQENFVPTIHYGPVNGVMNNLRAALVQQAEPVDTDCHTQGICQRSGYGIPKP
jgi:hypothetical protein